MLLSKRGVLNPVAKPGITLAGLLSKRVLENPSREAYVFRRPETHPPVRNAVTFQEVDDYSTVIAANIFKLGLRPGDRVALLGENCPQWIFVDFALIKLNIIAIRLCDINSSSILTQLLNKHRCKALVLHPGTADVNLHTLEDMFPHLDYLDSATFKASGLEFLEWIISMTEPHSRNLPNISKMMTSIPAVDYTEKIKSICGSANPGGICTTFLTSGSTGVPKCVAHSHNSIISSMRITVPFYEKQNGFRHFRDRNLSWIATCCYMPVVFNSTLVLVDPIYTLQQENYQFIYTLLKEENITSALLLPYILYDMADVARKGNLILPSTLQSVVSTGQQVPNHLLRQIAHVIKELKNVYASTEMGPALKSILFTESGFCEPLTNFEEVEVKITDDSDVVAIGHPGELLVRSPGVFIEYLDDPEHTRRVLTADGWCRSGDLAIMTTECKVKIIGRINDVISRAGRKVYPHAIENVFMDHPKVEKCAAIGVPDNRVNEEVCVFIVPVNQAVLTEEELKSYFQSQMLSANSLWFLPKYIVMRESFPLVNGKLDRLKLRSDVVDHFGLSKPSS